MPLIQKVGSAAAGLVALAALWLLVPSARAQTNFFWTNANAIGSWSTAASWTNFSGSQAPSAGGSNDYVLTFARTGTYTASNDVASPPFLLNRLVFGTTTATLRGTNLVFVSNSGGSLPQITWTNAAEIVYNNIVLSNNLSAVGGTAPAYALTLNGTVSGPGAITKSGVGGINMAGSGNSFTGGFTLNEGLLSVNGVGALGAGTLTLNGGTVSANGTRTIPNLVVVGGDWALGTNTLRIITFTSNMDLGGSTRTITVSGGASNSVFAGILSNGGMIKAGPGRLVFSNASSTYADGTFVHQGALALAWGADLASGVLVSNGATLQVTGGVSTVGGAVTNLGSVEVVNARVTWGGPVVVSGSYFSDPSTNIFGSSLTVAPSGSLFGSNGDLFVFNQDFINQSTNRAQFSLWQASVLFTNSASHLLSVSNSASADWGTGFTNFALVSTNFAIGALSIANGDRLTLAGNVDTSTNALYVGWLDLQGISTNSYDALTNGIFSALNLPNINLYYDRFDSRNAYLGGNGYDLWGGGALLPIPEPSSWVLCALGLGLLARRRRWAA